MVRAGRIGKVRKVTVALGKNQTGGRVQVMPVPKNLNWDRWLGPAPEVPYIPSAAITRSASGMIMPGAR